MLVVKKKEKLQVNHGIVLEDIKKKVMENCVYITKRLFCSTAGKWLLKNVKKC